MSHPARSGDADRELIAAILEGSREHFDGFYEAFLPRVYGYAFRKLGEDKGARRVTERVFVSLLEEMREDAAETPLDHRVFRLTRDALRRS